MNLVKEKLIELNLPFARKEVTTYQEERLFNSLARKTHEGLKEAKNISTARLKSLVKDFWHTNVNAKLSLFILKLSPLIQTCQCRDGADHTCGHRNISGIQNELTGILCQYLTLSVEANTSVIPL